MKRNIKIGVKIKKNRRWYLPKPLLLLRQQLRRGPSVRVVPAHRKHMFLSGGVSADSLLSVGCHYKEMSQHCGMNWWRLQQYADFHHGGWWWWWWWGGERGKKTRHFSHVSTKSRKTKKPSTGPKRIIQFFPESVYILDFYFHWKNVLQGSL